MEPSISDRNASRARTLLKVLLWIYVALTLGIATLNNAVAPKLAEGQARLIHRAYQIFENEFKTALVLVCAALAYSIYGNGPKRRMRKANLVAFGLAALVIHVALPFALSNPEIYYMAMPLPWSTTGLQVMVPESGFYQRHLPLWGLAGMGAATAFFIAMNLFVFVGSLVFGRRLQCSSLCLLNGFVAEVWAPALPLVGKRKATSAAVRRFLTWIRWIFFFVALGLSSWWLARALGFNPPGNGDFLATLETIKYLSLELLVAMVFWALWSGRGYCQYCPLGTALALIARLGRQRIRTDVATCISCRACDTACPMDIPISPSAERGEPVASLRCVGCGHCVDACPKRTLSYETAALAKWREERGR